MCTVTFIKTTSGKVILTSNRDEKTHRATLPPKNYLINNLEVAFPKDEIAGGTWIALDEKGVFCCLLNGGFQLHKSKGNYRRSRGQIVLDVFRSPSIEKFLQDTDLTNIEPFTLILYNSIEDKLNLLVWDERKKHQFDLDTNQPHFWASATLYSPAVTNKRREQFYAYTLDKINIDKTSIFTLHNNKKENGGYILDNRDAIETVSITQIILTKLKGMMIYNDLKEETQTTLEKTWKKVLP